MFAPASRVDDLSHLLTLDDLDGLIARSIRCPAVRMVRGGEPVPPGAYCTPTRIGGKLLDDVVDARRVAEQLHAGATLVAQSLHRLHPPLVGFADALMDEIGHPVQVNAYLTPPHGEGLSEHADLHDVFAVQLLGEKRWSVADLGPVVLRPGDVLYVPAGTRHRANAAESPSLHVTIGILRVTARAAFVRTLDDVAALDAPLPIGFHRDPAGTTASLRTTLTSVREAVSDGRLPDTVDAVVDREVRRELVPYDRSRRISSFVRAPLIDDATIIRWSNVRPRRIVAGQRTRVLLSDRVLRVPHRAASAISLIAAEPGGMRVGTIPGLSPASRIVLARRLVAEGACVVLSTTVAHPTARAVVDVRREMGA